MMDGVRCSGPLRTFVELGDQLGVVDLVVAGDALARQGVRPADLIAYADASTLPGAAHARRAARHVRARVDSPMETKTRMLMVLAGLPEPEVNVEFRDETGHVVRKHDLLLRSSRTIFEYAGRHHIEREQQ